MGVRGRRRPTRLAGKLLQIRQELGLSQTELLTRMGIAGDLQYTIISKNETGNREPTLLELLEYARLANVYMDVLVDDSLDLPTPIPSRTKSPGIPHKK
jgi:transcriptional regulator with XRE-family HTH domain